MKGPLYDDLSARLADSLGSIFSSGLLKNEFGVPISEFCDLWDFLWERVAGTSYFFLLKQDCQCAFSFFDVKRKLLADRYVTFLAHYIHEMGINPSHLCTQLSI